MSATEDRRAIRRAFGPAAVESIAELREAVAGHHRAIAELIAARDAVRATLRELEDPPAGSRCITKRLWLRHVELDDRMDRFASMSFWARRRWLWTGR